MISVNKRLLYGEVYNDVRCLSTDEKPVDDIRNGSTLVEIDTGTVYMFDATEKAWNEMPKGGGGGGVGVESFNGRQGAVRSRAGDYTASQVDTSTSGKTVQEALDELEPDAALSSTSTHPVQNKVIKAKLDEIEEDMNPEMSYSTRGGAKLEQHGGLALRDGALGIGSLVQESDGYARGGLAEVTAKGHAEQFSTTGKNLLNLSGMLEENVQVSASINSGTLTMQTTTQSNANYVRFLVSNISSGQYTVSYRNTSSSVDGVPRIDIRVYNNNVPINSTFVTGTNNVTITVPEEANSIKIYFFLCKSESTSSSSPVGSTRTYEDIQLEAGSTATAYEPYTGGAPSPSPDYPQEIQVVRGRNLAKPYSYTATTNGCTITYSGNEVTISGTAINDTSAPLSAYSSGFLFDLPAGTYTASVTGITDVIVQVVRSSDSVIATSNSGTYFVTFTTEVDETVFVRVGVTSGKSPLGVGHIQLEAGSTPKPYVPYGHVGMEVRDHDTDEMISYTPIPLPSRGWVAGLPDGTADLLRLDGAGKVEWELATGEVVLDGSSDERWTLAGNSKRVNCPNVNDYRVIGIHNAFYASSFIRTTSVNTHNNPTAGTASFSDNASNKFLSFVRTGNVTTANDEKTWLSTHPVTILYPLATPVTEDCGYVDDWPTDILDSATISIPELDEVGIRYFVDSSVTELARQWYERASSEYEDRLQALEEAMATIITGS